MFKERKSGFLDQGSFVWGIGVGIAIGAAGYLLYRRPRRETSPNESFRPPTRLPSDVIPPTDSANLQKGFSGAAGGPAEAEVG